MVNLFLEWVLVQRSWSASSLKESQVALREFILLSSPDVGTGLFGPDESLSRPFFSCRHGACAHEVALQNCSSPFFRHESPCHISLSLLSSDVERFPSASVRTDPFHAILEPLFYATSPIFIHINHIHKTQYFKCITVTSILTGLCSHDH